jgi:hypothetical protein
MSLISTISKNATSWLTILSKMKILEQPSSSMIGSRSTSASITSKTDSNREEGAADQPLRRKPSTTIVKKCYKNRVLLMRKTTQEQPKR